MAAIVKAAAMAREVREADGAEEWWLGVGGVGVEAASIAFLKGVEANLLSSCCILLLNWDTDSVGMVSSMVFEPLWCLLTDR